MTISKKEEGAVGRIRQPHVRDASRLTALPGHMAVIPLAAAAAVAVAAAAMGVEGNGREREGGFDAYVDRFERALEGSSCHFTS